MEHRSKIFFNLPKHLSEGEDIEWNVFIVDAV